MKLLAPFLALVSLASATPLLETRQSCTKALADQYLFSYTMSAFQSVRASKTPACFDWASDNCSSSPDNPFGYPFEKSCQRHDFGYRNYKKLSVFTEANRKKVDDKFKSDLYAVCGSDAICKGLANIYYEAVRACGDGNCFNKRDMERYNEAVAALAART